jgi:parallel beta-helix repeat protein
MSNPALTEAQWEALEEYNSATTYQVQGVGTYLGPTLQTAAPWAPRSGDYYVSKAGSDANDGLTPASSKLTIWAAFNAVPAAGGVTVWVDAGTYTENAAGGYFLFTKNFTNMVTVRGIPGTLPIIINSSGSYVIRPNGTCNNIRFRNLEIQSTAAALGFVFGNSALTNFELIECTFRDTNSRTSAINLSNASNSGISVKRCTLIGNAAFATTVTLSANTKIVGNNCTGVAVAQSITVSGSATVNSNTGSLTSIAINGGATGNTHTVKANSVRNIVHTGGGVGTESTLVLERNTVTADTGIRGIAISGYTTGGRCNSNTVASAGDTGIGWPIDGVTSVCTGHTVANNSITNTGTNGHALLLSTGATSATVTGNTTNATGGGSYGLVLKGTNNTVTANTFTGGTANGILLKDCSGCVVTSNTINSGGGGSAIALEFNGSSLNPTNCTVTGNTFNVTTGTLYNQLLAEIGTGNIVNNNRYLITGTATWGSLFSSSVSSLADVQARWVAAYDVTTNDNASTDV